MKRLTENTRQASRGFTLVELLVAMVVGMILLGVMYQLFLASTNAYQTTEQISRIQESGRFAVEFISRTARNAGFGGCDGRVGGIDNLLADTTFNWDFGALVDGFEATSNPGDPAVWHAAPPAALATALGGSDILTLRGPDGGCNGEVDTAVAAVLPQLGVSADTVNCMSVGDIVLLADCDTAEILQVTAVDVPNRTLTLDMSGGFNPGNGAVLSTTYRNGAQVARLAATSYFVAINPAGEPALFRVRSGAAPEELVEGVENMQVTYGVLGAGGVVTYQPAASGAPLVEANWGNVQAIRIGLLLRSPTENPRAPQDTNSYNINDVANFDPTPDPTPLDPNDDNGNDRRRRQVMVTTIALRNRL